MLKQNINTKNLKSYNHYKRYLDLVTKLKEMNITKTEDSEFHEVVGYDCYTGRIPGSYIVNISSELIKELINKTIPDSDFKVEKYDHPKIGSIKKISIYAR